MAHPTDESPTKVRYIVLAALAAGAILSYLLRVSLSPAGTTVQRELEISDAVMGDVFAAFFIGYFWFQIPGGWIGNRFGARLSLGVMGLVWAAATAVSAGARSTAVLQWSRVALGVTQAGLFPVIIMAIRDWFPPDRRGLASSVITACMSLGAVLASALSTRLLVRFGWRETFGIYGLLAAGWGLGFLAWFRDSPGRHAAVNRAELDLIQDTPPDACGGRADIRPRPDTTLSSGAAMLGMIRSPACGPSAVRRSSRPSRARSSSHGSRRIWRRAAA
jgi:MFS family permease